MELVLIIVCLLCISGLGFVLSGAMDEIRSLKSRRLNEVMKEAEDNAKRSKELLEELTATAQKMKEKTEEIQRLIDMVKK